MDDFSFLDKYNATIDLPDSRDISVEELGMSFEAAASLPVSLLHAKTPILNQGSIGACTIFGLSGATFEATYLDEVENGGVYNQPFDPWKFWAKAKERGASDTQGWSLQGALQLAVDLGYIAGYARLASPGKLTLSMVAKTIASGRMIYTGSARGNWRVIGQTAIYEEGTAFAGHAYCLTGYDPKNGTARNSWSDSWGKKGHFDIPETLLANMYSAYIILDPSDVDKMKDVRNARAAAYAKKAQDKKVWNGERPNDIASDEEIGIMIRRAADFMGARSRNFFASLFEGKILRGKGIVNIWNEKDALRNANEKEVAAMFTRAVKRNSAATSGVLTRFQVAAVVGRDLMP